MGRLRLKETAQVAEIVAAVAVIVSLVYVGRELESNTAAVRGAAMQAIATTDADALMTIAADSGLAEIVRVGSADPSRLSEAEAFRFGLYMRQFWLSFQNIFQQTELGLLDRSVWESYRAVICDVWRAPGSRALWGQERSVLSGSFVEVVERCAMGEGQE